MLHMCFVRYSVPDTKYNIPHNRGALLLTSTPSPHYTFPPHSHLHPPVDPYTNSEPVHAPKPRKARALAQIKVTPASSPNISRTTPTLTLPTSLKLGGRSTSERLSSPRLPSRSSASGASRSSAGNTSTGTPRASPKPAARLLHVPSEYRAGSSARSAKQAISLVIGGHVDAGKSTLMGHLLTLLGLIDDRTVRRYERESSQLGKGSFAFAWVLDQTPDERARGVTVDVSSFHFETAHRRVTLLDAPGHRDFVPNMIVGAAQADAAVLVVDATMGEFEAGFGGEGQTKEHGLLLRSLGVTQVIVAVNKLDVTDWSQDRFEEIVDKVGHFLTHNAGFQKSKIRFVPTSGLDGENLVKRSNERLSSWYSGETLIHHIDTLEPPERQVDKPLSLTVIDFWKSGPRTLTIAGRVDAGTLQLHEPVLVQPLNEAALVKTLEVNGAPAPWGVAGDQVQVGLVGAIEAQQMWVGMVVSSPSHPAAVREEVEARIVVFEIDVPIIPGFKATFHRQSVSEPISISKLHSILDKNNGKLLRRKPRALTRNTAAVVTLNLPRPIPIMAYSDSRELGRFTLRAGGRTVAAGVVTSVG